jgi:hypothetical protein
VIQLAVSVLTALAGLTSGIAAWLWYLASQVEAPKTLEGYPVWGSRMEGGNRVVIDASPIIDFAQESGRKNTAAAQWSATAAGLGFLVGMLSAYAAWPLHILSTLH